MYTLKDQDPYGENLKIRKLYDMHEYFGDEFVALEWAKQELDSAIASKDFKLIFQRIKDLRTAWSNVYLLHSGNSDRCYNTEYMLMHLLLRENPEKYKELFDKVLDESRHMTCIADAFLQRAHKTKAQKDNEILALKNRSTK